MGVRVLTEVMGPETYGELALGMTAATLINQFLLGPIGMGVTRFYSPSEESSRLGDFFLAMRKLLGASLFIIFGLTLIAILALWITGNQIWLPMVVLATLFAIFSGVNSLVSGVLGAARKRALVALHQGFEPWARFGFAVVGLLFLGISSWAAMLGFSLALLLVLLSQFASLRRAFPDSIYRTGDSVSSGELTRRIVSYSWPFAAWGIFTWAQLVSDRWALGLYSSASEVGLYAALYQLGYYPISLASSVLVQFVTPILYKRAGDGTDPRRAIDTGRSGIKLALLMISVTAIAFLLSLPLHDLVFRLFVGPSYWSVAKFLPPVLLSGGIFAASQILGINFMSQMKTKTLTQVKIWTAILGVGLSFVCTYFWGIFGTVVAGLVFSCVNFIWMSILYSRLHIRLVAELLR